jgi:hypothetical protein
MVGFFCSCRQLLLVWCSRVECKPSRHCSCQEVVCSVLHCAGLQQLLICGACCSDQSRGVPKGATFSRLARHIMPGVGSNDINNCDRCCPAHLGCVVLVVLGVHSYAAAAQCVRLLQATKSCKQVGASCV